MISGTVELQVKQQPSQNVAYEILDHIRSKCLPQWYTCRDLPHLLIYVSFTRKVNFEKDPVLPIKTFPSLVLPNNAMGSQHLIIQFSFYYLSSDQLREVQHNGKFQTFSSESGRGRLREVIAYKRFQI